jgi:hypothetical protein
LDDLLVRRGSCQTQPQEAAPQLKSFYLINCGFEFTFCNWKNSVENTQLNWTLNNASTPYNSGPTTAAAFTEGYLMLKSNGRKSK